MQTPPSTTNGSRAGTSFSEDGSPARVLFSDDTPGTPPSSGSFSFKGLLSPGRGGVSVSSGPPPAPSKSKSKSKRSSTNDPEELPSNALPVLPILQVVWSFICFLGAGSFGTVDKVVFPPPPGSPQGTPSSPPVAMKTVRHSPKQGSEALRAEAANVGSPGCASGVATTNHDGDLIIFTSVAVPLSSMHLIGDTLLEDVVRMTKDAIMKAPLSVVFDCKPGNLGFVCKGEATVIADVNGQPCAGPVTDSNSVVFLDLGKCHSPEEADKNFNPLLDDEELQTEKQQAIFREFKCKMMEALLRNQFADMPEDERVTVARICKQYDWAYAGGQQYQP